MTIHRLVSGVLGVAVALAAHAASAQFLDFRIESKLPSQELDGWITNDLFIDFDGQLSGVQMLVELTSGQIFQHPAGGNTPPNGLLASLPGFETLTWDTFVAMGGVTTQESMGTPTLSGGAVNVGGGRNAAFSEEMINQGWHPAAGEIIADQSDFFVARITMSGDTNGTLSFLSSAAGTISHSVVVPILNGSLRLITLPLVGDYNLNHFVEQGDLDLVLLHWGADALPPPGGWASDFPVGQIDQADLDRVLLNWGNFNPDLRAVSVPEPSSWALFLVASAVLGMLTRRGPALILPMLSGLFFTGHLQAVVVEGKVGFGIDEDVVATDGVAGSAYFLSSSSTPGPSPGFFHKLWFRQDQIVIRPGFPAIGIPDEVERLPSLSVSTLTLGAPANWYLVERGELFNAATIATGQFPPWATSETLLNLESEAATLHLGKFGEFYLGVEAPSAFGQRIDLFGWAHMRITPDGVEMLANAVSYHDERGIIVGNSEPIPDRESLLGDYNSSGVVEQGDLDLVLLNWGSELVDAASAGWNNDLPDGAVDQEELDKVLLNWGKITPDARSVSVPEPGTGAIAVLMLVSAAWAWRRIQASSIPSEVRANTCGL